MDRRYYWAIRVEAAMGLAKVCFAIFLWESYSLTGSVRHGGAQLDRSIPFDEGFPSVLLFS